jgi:tetratricopeptide (TPR) repeat protein
MLIAIILFAGCGDQERYQADQAIRTGNSHYRSERYLEAAQRYGEASFDARAVHNKGKAHYRAGEPEQAVEQLNAATAMMQEPEHRAHAYHDLGNASLMNSRWADSMSKVMTENIGAIRMEGDDIAGKLRLAVVRDSMRMERKLLIHLTDSALAQGVQAFKEALRNDPTDEDTRYNLALGQRLLASREKTRREAGEQPEKDEPLSERARLLIQQADELVEAFRFKDALELLQRGLQEDPTLAREKQYIDKLDVVTRAADAQ